MSNTTEHLLPEKSLFKCISRAVVHPFFLWAATPCPLLSHGQARGLLAPLPGTSLLCHRHPRVPCGSRLCPPPPPSTALPPTGVKLLRLHLQPSRAVGLACVQGNSFLLLQVCPVPSSGWSLSQPGLLDAVAIEVISPAAAQELSRARVPAEQMVHWAGHSAPKPVPEMLPVCATSALGTSDKPLHEQERAPP